MCGSCVINFLIIQKTKTGLYIPEKAQGKVNQATVIAVGPGYKDKVSNLLLIIMVTIYAPPPPPAHSYRMVLYSPQV